MRSIAAMTPPLMGVLAGTLLSACTLRLPLPDLLPAPPAVTTTSAAAEAAAQDQALHVPKFPPPRLSDRIIKRTCTVRFDDAEAIGKLPGNARDGIARWAQYNHEACDSKDGSGCWMYKRNCGPVGDVRLEELPFTPAGFYRLPFEQLHCQDPATGAGGRKGADGSCDTTAIDYQQEGRYAAAHSNEQVLRLWVQDEGVPAMFSVDKLRLVGDTGDRLAVSLQLITGQWLGWDSLPPGRYNMTDWAVNVVEMRFQGAAGTTSVAKLDDIRIRRLFVVE